MQFFSFGVERLPCLGSGASRGRSLQGDDVGSSLKQGPLFRGLFFSIRVPYYFGT